MLRAFMPIRSFCQVVARPKSLNNKKNITQISLDFPLESENVQQSGVSAFHEDKHTKITTLNNGLRIASLDLFGVQCVLGVIVDAGPKYETNFTKGISHIIEKLGFHSTARFKGRDALQQKMEECSSIFDCQTARDFKIYAISGVNNRVQELVDVLAETTVRPLLLSEEISMAQRAAANELTMLSMQPPADPILHNLLHMAAYKENSIGFSKFCPEENLERISREEIVKYHATFYRPERMILVGVGVNHDELVKAAERSFLPWEPSFALEDPSSASAHVDDSDYKPTYTGGSLILQRDLSQYHMPMPEFAHCVIGLECGGTTSQDFVPLSLLTSLLGGGGSFSAGGPGKGMYSRFYTNVLNQFYWANSAQATNHPYADTSLFAVTGSAEPSDLGRLAGVLVKELRYTLEKRIDPIEFARAQTQLKSMVLMNMEVKPYIFEDICRQVLNSGERKQPEYWIQQIDRATPAHIRLLLERMMKKKPTLVGFGRCEKLPSLEDIEIALATPSSSLSGLLPHLFKRFI